MGIIWTTCREGSLVGRKSGIALLPEKPEVAGVASVAGAVTPAPVFSDERRSSGTGEDRDTLTRGVGNQCPAIGATPILIHQDPLEPSSPIPGPAERGGTIRDTPSDRPAFFWGFACGVTFTLIALFVAVFTLTLVKLN